MTIKKPGIPSIQNFNMELASVLRPIKENIEIMTGARGGPVLQLASNATNAQIINKINELIIRLNQAGA